MGPNPRRPTRRVLVLDVGGTHVKVAFSDDPREWEIPSGPKFTPAQMVRAVAKVVRGRTYDAVSIGYPGPAIHGRITRDPVHLGPGWRDFDFRKAFGRPVRIANDAAMQALGNYDKGHMLFLGLGTGLGSAMVVEGALQPMELAHLPYKKGRTFEEYVGKAALQRFGRKKWAKEVRRVVRILVAALEPDEVVLGGGNAVKMDDLPPGVRRGDNREAIVGGIRLWGGSTWVGLPAEVPTSELAVPRRRKARGRRAGRRP
jgi:predicted NBD/HSP70 family sugar kinase